MVAKTGLGVGVLRLKAVGSWEIRGTWVIKRNKWIWWEY